MRSSRTNKCSFAFLLRGESQSTVFHVYIQFLYFVFRLIRIKTWFCWVRDLLIDFFNQQPPPTPQTIPFAWCWISFHPSLLSIPCSHFPSDDFPFSLKRSRSPLASHTLIIVIQLNTEEVHESCVYRVQTTPSLRRENAADTTNRSALQRSTKNWLTCLKIQQILSESVWSHTTCSAGQRAARRLY